jgi:hypothetical protein
MREAREVGQ